MKHFYSSLIIGSILLCLCSCSSSDSNSNSYKPVEGFNGKIKKITEYSYESDLIKNQMIALYGCAIPEAITEYNQYGDVTIRAWFGLPDDEDLPLPAMYIDSLFYNKHDLVRESTSILFMSPNSLQNYANPSELIKSGNAIALHKQTLVERKKEKGKTTEIRVSDGFSFINSSDLSPDLKSMSENAILESLYMNSEVIGKKDTTTTVKYFEGDRLIRQINEYGDRRNEHLYSYENGLLVKEAYINDKDTSFTSYTYKEGRCIEERRGSTVIRYDDAGHKIAKISGDNKCIYSHKDTTEVSSFSFKSFDSYSAHLNRTNSAGLPVMEVTIDLPEEELYLDDAVLLLEKYRDGLVSESELNDGVESLVLKSEDSIDSKIVKTSYENYDDHGNPLRIVELKRTFFNKYHHLSSFSRYYISPGVRTYDYKQITEREIEYY